MSVGKRRETDFYPEISRYLVSEISSNFSNPQQYHVAAVMGELRKNLILHIHQTGVGGSALREYAEGLADLQTDIGILILNLETLDFEILLIEVKLESTVGLTQLSQLVGYCLVSGATLGLLVNVGGGSSSGLKNKLTRDPELSRITRQVAHGKLEHKLGLMYWNPATLRLEYSNLGALRNISDIVAEIDRNLCG